MRLFNIFLFSIALLALSSCKKDSKPNYQYMPNMYEAVGYEAYSESSAFNNGVEAQLSVKGTIARGHSLYEFPNTTEGYNLAKDSLFSPLSVKDLSKGKELYDIYCGICHGPKGKGLGKLVKREKILGVPSYDSRDITEGSIYHVIYHGKNAMGSYANQLNESERWQVASYVLKLKSDLSK